MMPKMKLYLSSSRMEGVFGSGKWLLLDAVRTEGSICRAAARLGRSYRKAWGDIRRAEEGLGKQLVLTVRGGPGGGGAVLTPFAGELLAAWDGFRADAVRGMEKAFKERVLPLFAGAGKNLTREAMLRRKHVRT